MRALLLAMLPLAAIANPLPDSIKSHLHKRADMRPYMIEQACKTPDNRYPELDRFDKISKAIVGAQQLAQRAYEDWWVLQLHDDVAALYLGLDKAKRAGYAEAEIVRDNLYWVSKLTDSIPFLSPYINVQCTDINNMCGDLMEGTQKLVAAYATNVEGFLGTSYNVVLCEPWFKTASQDEQRKEWDGIPKEQMAMAWLETDAAKMLHEIMHIDFITQSRGHIPDAKFNGIRAYTAAYVAEWVGSGTAKTSEVINNADSYAQFTNTMFWKNLLGYLSPPDRQEVLIPNNDCIGGEDRYFHQTQDKNIPDFCIKVMGQYTASVQGTITADYNDGTPEHIQMLLNHGVKGHLDAETVYEQCMDTMPKIVHQCDTNSDWKHGGGYYYQLNKTEAGNPPVKVYEYSILGQVNRPDPVPAKVQGRCDVYYKFPFYDEFYIYGGL